MKKKCLILGYGTFEDKDTHDEMLRITMAIESNSEKYKGLMATNVFLKSNQILKETLDSAINDKSLDVYYETTDNIITGKTKVSNIFIG